MAWSSVITRDAVAQDASTLNSPTADMPSDVASSDSTNRGEEQSETKTYPRPQERARRTYMGRIVAKPMSHLGASWLVRPERNREENAREAFEQLQLQPGMTLVDLGCGNGFWTLPMAKACAVKPDSQASVDQSKSNKVKPRNPPQPQPNGDDRATGEEDLTGTVLAVDIQREMLEKLRANMAKMKITNVEPVLGKVDDPKLPSRCADLVLLVDVYHEFSHPESMLWCIRESLKPKGVIALLEYRAEDPTVPIKPLHKMSKAQIMKEYEASNLKLVREYNELPWQHLMFFARDDSPLPSVESSTWKKK